MKKLTTFFQLSKITALTVVLMQWATRLAAAAITNPALSDELGGSEEAAEAAASGAIFGFYFIRIWNFMIVVGGVMVLIYFVWGGVEWIVAGGDSGKIQKARDRIIQAVIGMIVLAGTFTLISFINDIFFQESFNLLNIQFEPI